jgi:hypothetical protein
MTKEYNVGDKVLLKNFRRKHGLGTVEQICYNGPYVIDQYCSSILLIINTVDQYC